MPGTSVAIGTQKQKVMFRCSTGDHWPLVISGDVAELGKWNLDAALPANGQRRAQGGSEWTVRVDLPLGSTVEYKFVKQTDTGPRWESGNNHRITVIPALSTLNADFQE